MCMCVCVYVRAYVHVHVHHMHLHTWHETQHNLLLGSDCSFTILNVNNTLDVTNMARYYVDVYTQITTMLFLKV